MNVYMARGHATIVDGAGRRLVDLGEAVSLAHAEGEALKRFFPAALDEHRTVVAVGSDEHNAARGLTLSVRFADILAQCPLLPLVENGQPAPAGSWAFCRVST